MKDTAEWWEQRTVSVKPTGGRAWARKWSSWSRAALAVRGAANQSRRGSTPAGLHSKATETLGPVRGRSHGTLRRWQSLPGTHRLCHGLPFHPERKILLSTGCRQIPEREVGPVWVPGSNSQRQWTSVHRPKLRKISGRP